MDKQLKRKIIKGVNKFMSNPAHFEEGTHQKGRLLKTDGTSKWIYSKEEEFTFEELNKLIDGDFEVVLTKDRREMLIDDEGAIKGLPINDEATQLYSGYHDLRGDAFILERNTFLNFDDKPVID